MKPSVIHVANLSKTFQVPVREAGLVSTVKSLIWRKTRHVHAVNQISFDIASGEVVGFLGPNGAGKTTTLKMLSGLLHPTAGEVRVLDYIPHKREWNFLRQISLVLGQRHQLQWDLPALDSYELFRAIYRIPRGEFTRLRDELIALFELENLVNKPVRNLSLGERMKCELLACLLHHPVVLFLDEPTIGLDVTMQRRVRALLSDYNQHYGATVLLTSHAMSDIEALCQRVIIIHRGRLLYDGKLAQLVKEFSPYKTIEVTFDDPTNTPPAGFLDMGEVIFQEPNRILLRVAKAQVTPITSKIIACLAVTDLSINDPPLEEVVDLLFQTESFSSHPSMESKP